MAFLKVLNVGQGDCLVLRPEHGCKFNGQMFYIDVGGGSVDVTKEIKPDDTVHLILTHHHKDHIEGLKYFFDNFNRIQDITVPYCFNEVALIARAILNLKGIQSAGNLNECLDPLTDITDSHYFLRTLHEKHHDKLKFIFAQEGDSLCKHLHFLNPPLPSESEMKLFKIPFESLQKMFYGLFEVDFAGDLSWYVNASIHGHGIDHSFFRYFIYERNDDYEKIVRQSRAGCEFVLSYIIDNYSLLNDFNQEPNKIKMQKICESYETKAHDACIVMKAIYNGRSYLLTGDASISVFERLINERKDISAYYLKVPHHGSKKNLNKRILSYINPRVAIISHDNKRFGRAKDPHPNKEVIGMLQKNNTDIYVTNSVLKDGGEYLKKINCNNDYLQIE